MRRFYPFFTIIICLFIYQNCGGYKAISKDGNSATDLIPVDDLKIRTIEMKRFVDDSGEYFQNVRVEITEASMFVVVEESDICQRSFILGTSEQQQVYDLFMQFSYREKGSAFPSESHLITELKVEDVDGAVTDAFVVTATAQENSLAPNEKILEQSPELVALIDSLLAKTYPAEQSACLSQEEIPRFIEYVWTDVVNNNSIVREAFLFEAQSDGNVIFLSLPDNNSCYGAYLLTLHEQAIALKALTRVVLDNNTQTPVNSNGVRYIDYHYENQQGQRYYIDGRMAPANSRILNNGEAITDIVLALGAMARQRYQATSAQPADIDRCIFE